MSSYGLQLHLMNNCLDKHV